MTSESTMTVNKLHYDGHDLEALSDLRNYQKWIAACFAPYLSGRAAEFGAGTGAISQWLVPLVDHMDLVEPSPNLVIDLAARFAGNSSVSVSDKSLQDYVADQPSESLDAAIMVNLLEHIEDDAAALRSLTPLLKPSGHLLLFVPAMPSLYSDLDRLVGHHRRYGRNNLIEVVAGSGYEIINLRYFDILGILPWWLINTLGGKKRFDPNLSTFYDRVGVPATRAIEALFRPPIGKNLLLIARPA